MGGNEHEILALAVRIAAAAAETARRMRTEAITHVDTKSTLTDVVTAADRAVEQQVIAALRAVRPDDAILGEEYGDNGIVAPGRVRWILDPIDGTVNYLYGLPQYAVSLAAELDGEIVAGVVHHAVTGDTWTAVRGDGAWHQPGCGGGGWDQSARGDGASHQAARGGAWDQPARGGGGWDQPARGGGGWGQPVPGSGAWNPPVQRSWRLTGSGATDPSQALIATGFGYAAERRAHQGRVVAALLPRIRDIRRMGSAALDLCAAAQGTVDAYFEQGLAAWDLAAGGLIAREAGLMVTGMGGAAPGPDLVLAAPPALHGWLHDALAELDASGGP